MRLIVVRFSKSCAPDGASVPVGDVQVRADEPDGENVPVGEDAPDGEEEAVTGIVLISSSEAILYCGVCTATR
jgi:hypothetical protein